MMNPRTSWTLALCLVTLAALPACKKDATTSPDGAAGGGEAAGGDDSSRGDDNDGGAGEEVLTVDAFEETMQKKQGDVADCFAEAKAAKPDLAGKLALDVTVAGDGSVASIKFEDSSTIKEASITSCVQEKAKGWRFPRTSDGNPMTLPYSLNLS